MNIIKLSAINSTNDYLKELSASQFVENFTIVCAEEQLAGKGQMGAVWNAEPGKNLTFSVLVKDLLLGIDDIFTLNAAVAVSVYEAMREASIPGLAIKWPNDILAENKKIGGILIENSIKNGGEIFSIIGIGLNVNQKYFGDLAKATSLMCITGRQYDKDALLYSITENIRRNVSALLNKDVSRIWGKYLSKLYKKDVPMPFQKEGRRFMGIITGVSPKGGLLVRLEDDTTIEYGLKEVQLLY